MKQKGFKAFNSNMENQYGMKFEEGKTYSIPEDMHLTMGPLGDRISLYSLLRRYFKIC